MPEILEVESARRLIEELALQRPIADVDADDSWYLKRGLTRSAVRAALRGHALTTARRRGKLLLLDVDSGAVLGLHLGMSGRVVIDGEAAGDPLIYASNLPNPAWHRFGLHFADGFQNQVTIGDYLGRDKPIVLSLVYFECPMLCSLVENGLVKGLSETLTNWGHSACPLAPKYRSPCAQ